MKKSNVDKILVDQTKRRKIIISHLCIVLAFIILSFSFGFLYFYTSQETYIKYNESSSIDYKVYLKENDFFEEEYLGKNRSYIASLIDYIDTTFNYNMALQSEKGDFKYVYWIEAEVDVKEKNATNSLYNFKEEILKKTEKNSGGSPAAFITENVKIDYNRYNELIKSFVKVYSLDDTVSTLTLRLHISILGDCEDFEDNMSNESSMAIEIPLTTRTMNIEISNDLIETENNIMACNKKQNVNILYLLFSSIMFVVGFFHIVMLIRYIITTRTAEDIYHKELKKILNNYHSYIQKINNEINLANYEVLRVDTFSDMLEIRDTLQQPILMVENKNQDGVYFLIPSTTKILYIYGLKLSDIKRQMKDSKNE